MYLELADNGNDRGHPLANKLQKSLTMPCVCKNGKPVYVQLPDGKFMRFDLFNQTMNDNGYDLSETGFERVFGKVLDTVGGIFGGGKQPAPSTTINLPGQQSGSDMMAMLMGMIMGGRGGANSLPGAPAYAPAPSMPSWILPAAVGGGILLLTYVLTKD
jgi:hypothetical protein